MGKNGQCLGGLVLDEAGVSRNEPYAVVSGVVVDDDQQLPVVNEYIHSLVVKYIPEDSRPNFAFHTKDIWSGSKFYKNRDLWPLDKRLAILHDLVEVPSKFHLPIVSGIVNKEYTARIVGRDDAKAFDFTCHACAYSNATQIVEKYLRHIKTNEKAMIIAEDVPRIKRGIKKVHKILQDKDDMELPRKLFDEFVELPYIHIQDTLLFAEKRDSYLLQLADLCAFVIRAFVNDHRHIGPLIDRLKPNIIAFESEEYFSAKRKHE